MSSRAIDIVIVNWNGLEDTSRALEATLGQIAEAGVPVSVIVVDNGSVDGSRVTLPLRFPTARMLLLDENRGFTGGVAAGVAASSAGWIILLNNDAIPQQGWLRSYINAASSAPDDIIALSGKIVDPTGTLVDFIGGVLTFDGHAFQNHFRKPLPQADEPASGAELLFACGGNMMVRRVPFLELGGFDDDYFAYLEDVDFGWRAWIAGWRIAYLPAAVARHRSSATSDRLGAFERGVLFEKNALQTVLKNYEDSLLTESAGAIFLTLLHRLHRYVVDRNENVTPLTRPPLEPRGVASGWLRRTRNRLRRRPAVPIDDELAIMQFRAVEWFLQNTERIMTKRAAVQSRRTRPDREIFSRFPLHYIPTYPGDEALMSSSLFKFLKPDVRSDEKTLSEIIQT